MNAPLNERSDPGTVVIAGAAGDLGARITEHLVKRGASVRAVLRLDASEEDRERIRALGATPMTVRVDDTDALATVCDGAECVVSAWSGLREVIVDRQSVLLDAAVRAGTPRFISSDFCSDYTTTEPGHNRNFDLRREFMGLADRAPITVTSIMNGAFMDMLGAEMPIIQPGIRRILYWGSADQPLDFTTRDDTAAFTAAAALDANPPRRLRIAGDTISARGLADVMTALSGDTYRPLWAGPVRLLATMAAAAKTVAPQRGEVFPAWQGMQYTHDMFAGHARLEPLDNDRYPDVGWTTVAERFADGHLPGDHSQSRAR